MLIRRCFESFFEKELRNFVIFIPVFFGIGIILQRYLLPHNIEFLFLSIAVILFSIPSIWYFRSSYWFLAICPIILIISGYCFTEVYSKTLPNKLSQKVYANVEGKVEQVTHFTNPLTKHQGTTIYLEDISISKIDKTSIKPEVIKDKPKKKPKKKSVKKKTKKADDVKSKNESSTKVEKPKKEKEKKLPKSSKSWLGSNGYSEVDREFASLLDYEYMSWKEGQTTLPNPPKRIIINVSYEHEEISVGDKIHVQSLLFPPDKSKSSPSSTIGAIGFASKGMVITKSQKKNERTLINDLRAKIRDKIFSSMDSDAASISSAFLIGERSEISQKVLSDFTNSGLLHLISISGLHMALAASIFFVCARFAIVRSEFLALRIDAKKIAAVFAIMGSFIYLKLAMSPIPAIRSFIMVSVVFAAIIFDRYKDAMRGFAFAALIVMLMNPYSIFLPTFQLSFIAVLAIISFYQIELVGKFLLNASNRKIFARIVTYLANVLAVSIIAQIATAPILFYHFGNFSTFSFIANLIAVPVSSIFTMPLGFAAVFSMLFDPVFNVSHYLFYAMGISVDVMIETARIVSEKFDTLNLQITEALFGICVGSFICACIFSTAQVRVAFCAVFLCSVVIVCTQSNKKLPDIILSKKIFAVRKDNTFLISKKVSDKQNEVFFKIFGSRKNDVKLVQRDDDCAKSFCVVEVNTAIKHHLILSKFNGKYEKEIFKYDLKSDKEFYRLLIILGRSQLNKICEVNADLVVNLTAKFHTPQCGANSAELYLDNMDFAQGETYIMRVY